MMPFTLLQALGDVDPALVERAAQPRRKVYPLRWVAPVAAAAVMVTALGVWWWGGRSPDTPTVTPPITTTTTHGTAMTDTVGSTTTTTATATTTTATTFDGTGTGGDEKSCVAHHWEYHTISISPAQVGEDVFNAFMEQYSYSNKDEPFPDPDATYPYQDCNYPESNIIHFVEFCGVTREQFIQYMGWDKYIAKMGEQAFLDHAFVYGDPTEEDMQHNLFTYGEYLDAIYGDDPRLTAWVFDARASCVESWPYQYYYSVVSTYPMDPLAAYMEKREDWNHTFDYRGSIVELVREFNVIREEFIAAYGWQDKLDEKATDHFLYAPYTYRQFVDAVYGDDEALRAWVFDCYVFHPDYPSSP